MFGLTDSFRERWNGKGCIQVPRYQDVNTDHGQVTEREPFPGQIYMDSIYFGAGASCLQLTYESQSINHARFLYDMLLPFTPIMSALSASSSILKGQVAEHDFRWEIIEQALDDRTHAEKDENSPDYIPRSRWSPASQYISNHEYVKDFHNDIEKKRYSEIAYNALIENGLDERLALHISTLFIRSPLPIY